MILIGQLAKITGLSIRTIRFYEEKNVLTATSRDAQNNRLYDDDATHWLLFVKYLRQTGMSIQNLAQYRQLVDQGDQTLSQRILLLRDQRAKVVQQIEDKNEQLRQIDHKLAHYQDDLVRYI